MSGTRDMRTFLLQHRSQAQDLHEQNHLVTRALNGLSSDRYRKTDYETLKKMAEELKYKSQDTESKVKSLNNRVTLGHELTAIKQQNMIWQDSFNNMSETLETAEESCNSAIINFCKLAEIFDPDLYREFRQYAVSIEEDIRNFDDEIVETIRTLKSDLQYRVNAMHREPTNAQLHDPNHNLQVKAQVEDVKRQADDIAQRLQREYESVEDELSSLANFNSNDVTIPAVEHAVPADILNVVCYSDIKDQIIDQFFALHAQWCAKEESATRQAEGLRRELRAGSWSGKERRAYDVTYDVYQRHTPDHLAHKRAALHAAMLKLMLGAAKSRRDILAFDVANMRLRFVAERRKAAVTSYRSDVAHLHDKALTAIFDANERELKEENEENAKLEQRKICDALHAELQEMRARQAEIIRIEELLAEENRAHREEEMQRQLEQIEKKRSKDRMKIGEFQRRRTREREEERAANVRKLRKLKREMEEQRKIDRERVRYRDQLYLDKVETLALVAKRKEEEKVEMEKRLDAIRSMVAVRAEADPARLVQDTTSTRAKLGIGTNQDVNLQAPLFTVYGFNREQMQADVRVRVEAAMRAANLHGTDYARHVISTIQPPTRPRPDNDSTAMRVTAFNHRPSESS